ncbi:DUF5605 domain-containing protein [Bacteroidota bacterium]
MRHISLLLTFLIIISLNSLAIDKVEIWDYYEVTLTGPEGGNPFSEVELEATFTSEGNDMKVVGFYNGNGVYKVRFMPDETGTWKYVTKSNKKELNGKKGKFECIPASEGNHGLVKVDKKYHFKYADGKPFYPFGTTCYAWTNQPHSIQEQTLETLSTTPFNKIRMCVFPQNHYWHKIGEPSMYAFEGKPNDFDYSRFNTTYFDKLEKRILQLQDMGIECDLIIFHPYDRGRWGYDQMTDEQDDFYLRYLMARLSSFRNIWWSLANEYDQMQNKQMEDWDRFFQILQKEDTYQHLRSIHNWNTWYDHTKPWVTHVSVQDFATGMRGWIEKYQKPVIVDECRYEGNMHFTWADLTPEKMTQQFWDAVTKGGYASHGETYMNPTNYIWWAQGSKLYGKSVPRIAFLKKIIEDFPSNGLLSFNGSPIKWNRLNSVRLEKDYFLFYYGERQHAERYIELPEDREYKIEIIDTWEMTITKVDGVYRGETRVELPSKPYIALRVTAIDNK